MMIGMDEFLGKLWSMEFGAALLGAVAGGAFSILGAWWQSRSANKATALTQAQANAQRAFDTLTELRAHLEAQTFQGIGTGDTRAAWNRELRAQIARANSAIMLLPEKHKETRGRALTLLRMIENWEGLPPWPEYKLRTGLLLSEALKYLGLFVRGSDVPEKRDMTQIIAREIEHYQRQQAHRELESLERDAEHSGLDEEDMQRARDLREFLGLPPLPEPSDEDDDTAS
jgi:hypothetical protein